MDLINLQSKIGNWHRLTFTDATLDEIAAKVQEESRELMCAHADYPGLKDAEECADVAIALLSYCERAGINLLNEIEDKMIINERRKWYRNAAGQWERKK